MIEGQIGHRIGRGADQDELGRLICVDVGAVAHDFISLFSMRREYQYLEYTNRQMEEWAVKDLLGLMLSFDRGRPFKMELPLYKQSFEIG